MTRSTVLLLIVIPGLVRGAVYLLLPPAADAELTPTVIAYFSALRDHFAEYLWTTTNRPPLTYVINATFGGIFGPSILYGARVDLLLSFAANTLGGLAVFLAARRAGAAAKIALGVGFVFSLGVIPFELWRVGRHYDHHTLPLVALFVLSAVCLATARRTRDGVLAGVAGGLLVAQSPTNLYVAPAVLAAALMLRRRDPLGTLRRGGLVLATFALLPPLAVGGAIVAKNLAEARLPATGNQAGSSVMIFIHDALRDQGRAAALVRRAPVPDWFRWCYEERVLPPGTEGDQAWDILARSFGICFPWQEPGSDSWPFDVAVLEQVLRREGAHEVAELLARDARDMRERQYLFAGYSPEQSLRWTGQYGQNATIVARQMLLDHPTEGIATATRVAAQYGSRGPLLPLRALAPQSENGMRTVQLPWSAEAALRICAAMFAAVMLVGHWGLIPLLVIAHVRPHIRLRVQRRIAVLLAVPMLLLGASFTLAAWDVDRYFMQSTPYVAVSAALILTMLTSGRRPAVV